MTEIVTAAPVTETLGVIARRYSCRAFTGKPVPHDTLRAIAEAAACAPSAINRQPWRVVLVEDKSFVDELGAIGLANLHLADEAGYVRIQGRGGLLFYNAPAMVVIAAQPQPGRFGADLDVGIVASHIALAATSLGVDSCICGLAGFAFEGAGADALKARLGFPEGFDFALSVLLGYAASSGAPHAPALDKIIEAGT